MKINLSDFRYTRNLARVYRASMARQEVSPQEWREDGIQETLGKLHAALDWWLRQYRDGERIYRRATQQPI